MKGENIIDSETRVMNCIYAALAKNDGQEGGVIKLDQTPFSIPHIAVLHMYQYYTHQLYRKGVTPCKQVQQIFNTNDN